MEKSHPRLTEVNNPPLTISPILVQVMVINTGPTEGTIELFMNGKWWIFATEEARQKIQFPSIEDELSKFYLTIGSEGVKSIELAMSNSSGGCAVLQLTVCAIPVQNSM